LLASWVNAVLIPPPYLRPHCNSIDFARWVPEADAARKSFERRSCPKRLEGTGMMIADTGYFIAVRFGDLFGSWLYVRGGFSLAAWITTAVYALMLPMLLFVPREVF